MVRHYFFKDKITDREFKDVNRCYLTNRCIGAAFLPFLPFSSARIGRQEFEEGPLRETMQVVHVSGRPQTCFTCYILTGLWVPSILMLNLFLLSSFFLSKRSYRKKRERKDGNVESIDLSIESLNFAYV